MKTKHKITAIAFVVAASLSVGSMAAEDRRGGKPVVPDKPVVPEVPVREIPSASSASILDVQISIGNHIENRGTENNALVEDSLQEASGNAGANVAAGDGNQQANALAISTADADADFVFGNHSASASVVVGQLNAGNVISNRDVTNNATLDNAADAFSGNLGVNIAAGAFNQQKNDATIANATEAQTAEASIKVLQVSAAGTTFNGLEAGDSTLDLVATGFGGYGRDRGHQTNNQDVENNATLVSSLNNFSGNAGLNIAAGGTNQQSNTLSIAAGCSGCPSPQAAPLPQ